MASTLELVAIPLLALLASILTLVSGFGLGTLLLPAFALAFPLDVAVAATAVVHLVNNLAKGGLLGRHAHRRTVLRFGLPAAVAAVVGAAVLLLLTQTPLWTYDLGGTRSITPMGLVLGALVTAFAAFELVPALRDWHVRPQHLPAGGLVSGFFGGLSGHQGALRSVFLTKLRLDPLAYAATGTVCAILVDVARLVVYSGELPGHASSITAAGGWGLVGLATAAAIVGAVAGRRLVGAFTVGGVRTVVGVLLLLMGPAIALGLV